MLLNLNALQAGQTLSSWRVNEPWKLWELMGFDRSVIICCISFNKMTYELNQKVYYAPYGKHAELITGKDLSKLHITVQDGVTSAGFDVGLQDEVFDLSVYKYYKQGGFYDAGGYQSAKSAYNFQHDPMRLWETQLNFAVHCATSGLGVSTVHLNAEQSLVRSLYRFHVYYHIRRILKRMLVPTPSEEVSEPACASVFA